jgi:hypothetical protein
MTFIFELSRVLPSQTSCDRWADAVNVLELVIMIIIHQAWNLGMTRSVHNSLLSSWHKPYPIHVKDSICALIGVQDPLSALISQYWTNCGRGQWSTSVFSSQRSRWRPKLSWPDISRHVLVWYLTTPISIPHRITKFVSLACRFSCKKQRSSSFYKNDHLYLWHTADRRRVQDPYITRIFPGNKTHNGLLKHWRYSSAEQRGPGLFFGTSHVQRWHIAEIGPWAYSTTVN